MSELIIWSPFIILLIWWCEYSDEKAKNLDIPYYYDEND